MLSKLSALIRRYGMISPGDRIICAVSGGADSMALLWAMYLLKDKLSITLEAVHFNHGLRGGESDRDEAFVRDFCKGYGICCHVGRETVVAGKKGLEAAARDARYCFFSTLDGKIATAHTADDNAETVLMHMVRGTGLKGLGGISPVRGDLIRPMLCVTRQEVLDFLGQYHIAHITDSSNETDDFLRNRLRHHVMPLLLQENPRLAQNLSDMAMDLRWDEDALQTQASGISPDVQTLRAAGPAVRRRVLTAFLKECGVKEPEREHIAMTENLVFSHNPSACADLPGGVRISRRYDRLEAAAAQPALPVREVACPGVTQVPEAGICLHCSLTPNGGFSCSPVGRPVLRCRQEGDTIRLSGGTKSLKKLFIDRKVPAQMRNRIPVLADDRGVLAVYGIGPNLDRTDEDMTRYYMRFETINKESGGNHNDE